MVAKQITSLDSKLPAWALRAHTVYLSDNNVVSLKGVTQVRFCVLHVSLHTYGCDNLVCFN